MAHGRPHLDSERLELIPVGHVPSPAKHKVAFKVLKLDPGSLKIAPWRMDAWTNRHSYIQISPCVLQDFVSL